MKTINLTVPTNWNKLSQKEMIFLFKLISMNMTSTEIKTLCFFKFSNCRVLTQYKSNFLIKIKKNLALVSPLMIAGFIKQLDWIDEIPDFPIRPDKIRRSYAVPADLDGVSFGNYIACDNYYQGFLATKNFSLIAEMAKILYNNNKIKLEKLHLTAVFYWWTSLKSYFAKIYPNLFSQSSDSDSQSSVKDAMNTQIRALTKGDITKESEILNMECSRALTELDAQAKEYSEITSKYGK